MTQLDQLENVGDDIFSAVEEFLAWILEKGVILDGSKNVSGTLLDTTKFVYEFFDIDPVKLEAERKQLFDVMRARGLV